MATPSKPLSGIIPIENRGHIPGYYTSTDGLGYTFVAFDIYNYNNTPAETLDAGEYQSAEGRGVRLTKLYLANPPDKVFDRTTQLLLRVDEFETLAGHMFLLKDLDALRSKTGDPMYQSIYGFIRNEYLRRPYPEIDTEEIFRRIKIVL